MWTWDNAITARVPRLMASNGAKHGASPGETNAVLGAWHKLGANPNEFMHYQNGGTQTWQTRPRLSPLFPNRRHF